MQKQKKGIPEGGPKKEGGGLRKSEEQKIQGMAIADCSLEKGHFSSKLGREGFQKTKKPKKTWCGE